MTRATRELLLTPEQVAEQLGLHVKTVRRYIREGQLAAVKVGKRYRVPREALESFTGAPLEQPAAPTGRPLTEVSTILAIDELSRDGADRLTTLLLASAGNGQGGPGAPRVECIHYPERNRLKVVCHGDLASTMSLLALANALLEDLM